MKWLERVLHGIGVFFEERTEGFQIWEIDIGQEATQARSMGQTSAFKQSHEGRFERLYALVPTFLATFRWGPGVNQSGLGLTQCSVRHTRLATRHSQDW